MSTASIIFLIVLLVYWLSLSIWSHRKALSIFHKYSNPIYCTNPAASPLTTSPSPSRFNALVRTDYRQWNKQLILIGCWTLLPIRILVFCLLMFGCLVFAALMKIFGHRTVINNLFTLYLNTFGKFATRLMCRVQEMFQDRKIRTPIVISNHINWFDIFFITMGYAPLSFVAKAQVLKWPVVGILAKARQCVFVARDSQNGRKQTRQGIKQRIDDINGLKKNKFPLVIFPEGTTSNGKGLLTFKNGAFQNMSSITAFCLRYQCKNFSVGLDQLSQSEHVILMMSQLPKLIVQRINFQPNIGQNSQQYENRCRKAMANILEIQCTDGGYRDKLELQQLRIGKKGQ